MQTITVQTAYNVTIDYELATIGERIGALFIDLLVQISYIIGIFYLIFAIKNSFDFPSWLIIMMYLPVLFYELGSEIILEGQSLGKRAMNIKVIMLDGSQPHIANYFLRWLVRLFEVSSMSGVIALISIAVSTKGQRIGDIAAGTSVIKLGRRKNIQRPSLMVVEDDEYYISLFPEVAQLSDKDVNIAREVLDIYLRTGNLDSVKNLNYKLREVLGIYSTNSFSDVNFLKQLIKDYENLTAK